MTDLAAVRALSAATEKLDILVNCAAITSRGEEMEPAFFEHVVNVNLHGTFRTAEAFYPQLKAQRGVLINIASMYATFGSPRNPAYGASKAAVAQLTKSLAIAWARGRHPRQRRRPRLHRHAAVGEKPHRPGACGGREPAHADGPLGQPEDIAGPVLFLASSAAQFMTGVCLPIDGGYSIA